MFEWNKLKNYLTNFDAVFTVIYVTNTHYSIEQYVILPPYFER